MTTATNDRAEKIVATISKIAGRRVELTVRGLKEFTFSFDGIDESAERKIISYFGSAAACEVMRSDEEDDQFTCVYVNVK